MTELDTMRRQLGGRGMATAPRPHAHVTAVAGGKGGVGTSTVATLLAAANARTGRSVLLVDAADATAGGLCALLGIAVDSDPAEPALVPLTPHLTLALPPAGRTAERSDIERRVLFRRLIALFDAYDVVVVDAGARLDTIAATLAGGAGELLVIGAPDRVTLAASYALLKIAASHAPRARATVLINRAGDAEAVAAYRSLRTGAERFLARIPDYGGALADEQALARAVDERRLLQTELAALHTLARLAVRASERPQLRVT